MTSLIAQYRKPLAGILSAHGSTGFGTDSLAIDEQLKKLARHSDTQVSTSPFESSAAFDTSRSEKQSATLTISTGPATQSKLFDALAAAKVATAMVAMHMDSGWRNKIFQQLDSLHDPESWEDYDQPVSVESYRTFLRMLLAFSPIRRPGLSLGRHGALVGAWTRNKDRLTIEFQPNDEVRWVLVRYTDGERESAAGQNHLQRLKAVLEPYDPAQWFADAAGH